MKEIIKKIHTETVHNAINNLENNRILKTKPPDIDKSESSLPRKCRSELARLRSGFSRKVNSYMSRIDSDIEDKCPLCYATPHDVEHLFNCSENPTNLNVIDLWKKPTLVSKFLKLDEDDEVTS